VIRLLSRRGGWRAVLLLVIFCLGCGGGQKPGQVPIRGLSVCYGQYQARNRGQAPPSEKDFKEFIQKQMTREFLEGFGASPEDLDKLFISPRDKEPYQVRYKALLRPPGPDGKGEIVIWEKEGVNGKRMVAYSTTKSDEIDDATFKELMPGH
jgi:hypothetical protein